MDFEVGNSPLCNDDCLRDSFSPILHNISFPFLLNFKCATYGFFKCSNRRPRPAISNMNMKKKGLALAGNGKGFGQLRQDLVRACCLT